MAAIQEFQNVLDETLRVNPIIYYSGKHRQWQGSILKTDFKFADKDIFKVFDDLIKHIKENRKWNSIYKKYEYWGKYKDHQVPKKYRQ